MLAALVHVGVSDELRAPEIYGVIEEHAQDWSRDDKAALAVGLVRELLSHGWVLAGSYGRDPAYREKQDRWERENGYGPGLEAPAIAIWVPWTLAPSDAADRIAREWPADPYDLALPNWELVVTELGTAFLAKSGGGKT